MSCKSIGTVQLASSKCAVPKRSRKHRPGLLLPSPESDTCINAAKAESVGNGMFHENGPRRLVN